MKLQPCEIQLWSSGKARREFMSGVSSSRFFYAEQQAATGTCCSHLAQYWAPGIDPPASVGVSLLERAGVDALSLESRPTWQFTKNLSSATLEIVFGFKFFPHAVLFNLFKKMPTQEETSFCVMMSLKIIIRCAPCLRGLPQTLPVKTRGLLSPGFCNNNDVINLNCGFTFFHLFCFSFTWLLKLERKALELKSHGMRSD